MKTSLKTETEEINHGPDLPHHDVSSLLPVHAKEGKDLLGLTPSLSPSAQTETMVETTLSVANEVDAGRPSRPGLSAIVDGLVAVTSEEYERYGRKVTMAKYSWDGFMIEPLRVDFSAPMPQNGWQSYIHPEGVPYFHNASWHVPVITDVFVYETSLRERLEPYIHGIFAYINEYKIALPTHSSLVVEFRLSGRCGYYFVDHTAQCLFWLDDFDATVFLGIVNVKYTPSLVGLEMKSLYWRHNAYFPHLFQVREGDVQDMNDLLVQAIGDSLTSPSGTTPYSVETLEKMLSIINNIRANTFHGPGSGLALYRFLLAFYHEKFLNLHGEHGARLDIDQSIHPEISRSLLIRIVSPVLLFGPDVQLRRLKEVSVDSIVRERRWVMFLKALTDGWKEVILCAMLLLNANIVFLAIQRFDTSAEHHSHSAIQRSNYFSIIINVGGILLGLLLVWQHEYRLHCNSFIASREHSVIGLETLAIMYSLPHSLLMWSFVSFLLAFLLMCLNSFDVTTYVMIGISATTLLLLLGWTSGLSLGRMPFRNSGPLSRVARPEVINAGIGRLA